METRLQSFYIQMSKEDWLCLGDSNDKFFYESIKHKQHINRISSILREDDTWTSDY